MLLKKIDFKYFIIISCIFIYSFIFFDKNNFINFFFSFLSSLLIILSSFYSYYSFVKSNLNSNTQENKFKFFVKSSGLFFSIYKVFAYLLFIICFLYLLHNNIFSLYYYLFGVFFSIIVSIVISKFLKRIFFEKQS